MDLKDKIRNRQARIGIIGLGYVGLPLAVEFAKAGFETTMRESGHALHGFGIDGHSHGELDTIGDVLSLSPMLMEKSTAFACGTKGVLAASTTALASIS